MAILWTHISPMCRISSFLSCFLFYFFSLGHTTWLVESQFPDQGLNPGPQQCEHRVLTAGLPGNSWKLDILDKRLQQFGVLFLFLGLVIVTCLFSYQLYYFSDTHFSLSVFNFFLRYIYLLTTSGLLLSHRGLSCCGAWAQLFCGMWNFPRPGIEPIFPTLQGRFSTTGPPGKSQMQNF